MTEREIYALIKETMGDNADVVAFCDKKVTAMDKKAAKAKEKSAKGDELCTAIKAVLTSEPMTIADVVSALSSDDATQGKVTYRLSQMANAGEIQKQKIKVDKRELTAYTL